MGRLRPGTCGKSSLTIDTSNTIFSILSYCKTDEKKIEQKWCTNGRHISEVSMTKTSLDFLTATDLCSILPAVMVLSSSRI